MTCEIFYLRINCSFYERHQKRSQEIRSEKKNYQKCFNIPMRLQWMSVLYIEAFHMHEKHLDIIILCTLLNSVESITKTLTLRKYVEIFCPTDATPKIKDPKTEIKNKKNARKI